MKKRGLIGLIGTVLLMVVSVFGPVAGPALADSGTNIAISGTFYRQHFKLLPGESLATPDIYVVIFNKCPEEVEVHLTPTSPEGVDILMEENMTIPAGEKEMVEIGVNVSPEAVPGDYSLLVTAEIKQGKQSGISVTGAAQQQARLTVLGEAGEVFVKTILPTEETFPAEIRLYQKEEGELLPFGYSDNGELRTRAPSGDYLIQAFYKDKEVARKEFFLGDKEEKEILLTAQTVFIYGFAVTPVYGQDQKEVVSMKATYNIENIYKPLKNVETFLAVDFSGQFLEKAGILSLPTLDTGMTGGNYQYTPSQGMQNGLYEVKLAVYSNDLLYAESQTEELEVKSLKKGIDLTIIIITAIAVIAIIVIIILLIRRRRD